MQNIHSSLQHYLLTPRNT